MLKKYKFIFVIFSILLLTACATAPVRQPLNEQDKVKIKSNSILLNSTQREISMRPGNMLNGEYADPYMPMDSGAIVQHNLGRPAGGLLAMLVVTGVEQYKVNNDLQSMVPVKNALANFDFMTYFNSELHNSVAKLNFLKTKNQKIKFNILDSETQVINATNENTTLLIGATYALNSVFRQLEVAAYVKLLEKPIGNQKSRILYANNFFFVNRLSEPNENQDTNKNRWLRDNGELLKTKLREAASQISQMIVMDITNANLDPYGNNSQLIYFHNIEAEKVKGRLIKQENNYNIVALDSRELYAINSDDIMSS